MHQANNVLTDAVSAGKVPFAVAMVSNDQGPIYSFATGDAKTGHPADEQTAFRIYSMTKAVGSLAAMILIDRGQLTLDTPVAEIDPAWNDLQVLTGWDGDRPVLRPQHGVATIRHLATHTSGLEYEIWNPDIRQYLKTTGNPPMGTGRLAGLQSYPLATDPGTRWGYGTGIDWLGHIVEMVDGRRIDAFCRDEIFGPLGMNDTDFEPDALQDRLADVRFRNTEGEFEVSNIAPPSNPEIYGMGHALYSTAPDYLTFLRMILNRGTLNDHQVLSPGAMDVMLADQTRGLPFRTMRSAMPGRSADVELPPGTTHSFAFVRTEQDQPGKRRAGAQGWAGICNTHYWVDPAANIAAVLMTQSLPFMEPAFAETYDAFERAVYAGL